MDALALSTRADAGVWLGVGAVALYAASRMAAEGFAGNDPGRAGWRAVGHWLPVVAVALCAVFRQRAELALGVIFATGIASLSLMMGLVVYFSTIDDHPVSRRAWPFVLPAALLVLVAGFSGHLSWLHASMMLILGAAVWSVWTDPAGRERGAGEWAAVFSSDPAIAATDPQQPTDNGGGRAGWKVAAAALLALVGGWAATRGAVQTSTLSQFLPLGILAAGVLSPILTMPMLASGSSLAVRGHASSMAATLVGVALLNLCALLPACVLLWHVTPGLTRYAVQLGITTEVAAATPAPDGATTAPTTTPIDDAYMLPDVSLATAVREGIAPMPYPLAVWRVDTVVLLVLGFVLIPVAIGRLTLGKGEAAGLIFGYAIYLALVMALGARIG